MARMLVPIGVARMGLAPLVLLAALGGCGGKSEAPAASTETKTTDTISYPPGAPELDSLQLVTAKTSPLPVSADLNARLVVDEAITSRIGAPVAGRVTQVLADSSEAVRAGQPLAYLDAPDLGQARADVVTAQARSAQKARELDRSKLLLSGGAIARRDLELAQADAQGASAELQRAQLRLRNLGGGSGDALALTSTVSGFVVDRQINPGQQVSAGQGPLFTVSDPHHLWLMVDVPENSIARARIGEVIDFDVAAYPDRHFSAKITRIDMAVDPTTRRVTVRAEVANPDLALRPEMYARARLITDDGSRAVKVPNAALFEQSSQSYLFRVVAPGKFRRVPVKVGERGEAFSYVTEGLSGGERIVGEGALLLNAQLAGD